MTTEDRLQAFHQHRAVLFSIAYRMLGSLADAEDMLQESFIRWQQVAPDVEIGSTRAYLVTILSRLCINHLQSARVKREQYVGQWLPEPLVTSPNVLLDLSLSSQLDDSISMAFLVLMERLTPMERAVFLLREVFDYEYSEIAQTVNQSESNCRQILRRARQHIKEARPRFDPSPQQRDKLLKEFLDASLRGDLDGLVAVLSNEITFYSDSGGKAAALPNPIYGAQNVARAVLGSLNKFVPRNIVSRFARINGQPGIVNYMDGHPHSVLTVDVINQRICNIYVVSNPKKLERLPLWQESPESSSNEGDTQVTAQ
jgi:RNA polymerase sigma-70 factor (ECF subfamily)